MAEPIKRRRAVEVGLPFEIKPPYAIPRLAEIADGPRNGYRVVSTFSGCGGSCLGFEMAGFRPVYANEFVDAARETYAANHRGVFVDGRDIRSVTADSIRARIGGGEIHVLEGSPPCASFSVAGKRDEHWGKVRKYSDTKQRVDDLFFEFLRLVKTLRPMVVVAENVPGLRLGAAMKVYNEILSRFGDAGYLAKARVLNAQWFGVPQARRRLIFVAVRRDLGVAPVFPEARTYCYSVRDALPWLDGDQMMRSGSYHSTYNTTSVDAPAQTILTGPGAGGGAAHFIVSETVMITRAGGYSVEDPSKSGGRYPNGKVWERSLDDPSPTILAKPQSIDNELEVPLDVAITDDGTIETDLERALAADEEELKRVSLDKLDGGSMAIGDEWDKLGEGDTSPKFFNLIRAHGDLPSPTVTATGKQRGAASVTHPTERRKFTIAELRRICGFPDDFVLTGTREQQWERLGRAVPPPLMAAIAAAIRDEILDTLNLEDF